MCSRTEICIRKKNSCLAGGICAKPHSWKCGFAGRRGSVGWLCVILSGLRCSRSRSTPLQAGEMGFLPQPRALTLKLDGCFPTWKSGLGFFFGSAFDPAELLFSYPEIRVGFFWGSAFDPAELQCTSQGSEPQKHFGNIPCSSRQCLVHKPLDFHRLPQSHQFFAAI